MSPTVSTSVPDMSPTYPRHVPDMQKLCPRHGSTYSTVYMRRCCPVSTTCPRQSTGSTGSTVDSVDMSSTGPTCPRQAGHVLDRLIYSTYSCSNHTTPSRYSTCMHQDPTPCSLLAQALDSHSTASSSKAAMSPSVVVQNLQMRFSHLQSTFRAKDRVERCTKRIAYHFSTLSASFRG